jgi:hypothetical protein
LRFYATNPTNQDFKAFIQPISYRKKEIHPSISMGSATADIALLDILLHLLLADMVVNLPSVVGVRPAAAAAVDQEGYYVLYTV